MYAMVGKVTLLLYTIVCNCIQLYAIVYSCVQLYTTVYGCVHIVVYALGIYLPLECDSERCYKSPLLLAYDRSHFTAVVTMAPSKSKERNVVRGELVHMYLTYISHLMHR